MIAYAAGAPVTDDAASFAEVKAFAAMGFGFELEVVSGYPHILISFLYDAERNFFADRLRYWPRTILGDSGAFTVWTKGDTVDLAAYIDWCRGYSADHPEFLAITLDVIPGALDGGAPSRAEREVAMAGGLENSDVLRAAGVPIMEVFHWHEPTDHLRLLLERRQPGEVLGVGGLAGGGSITAKRAFCDSVFATVKDVCGGWDNLPPIHALGVSPDSPLAARYPWWSVDSSSWASPAKFGRHVSKAGRRGGRDSRTSNKNIRQLYLTRVLEGWNQREVALTKMWHDRGVRFDVPPLVDVC